MKYTDEDRNDVQNRTGCLLWVAIILLFIFASCKPIPYVVQDTRITIKNNVATLKPVGPATQIPDTVMVVKMIRRRSK